MRLIKGQEQEHHRLAYYEYLDCRTLREVSRRTKYCLSEVVQWAHSFDWEQRVKLYDLEIQKKTEKKLIDDKVKRNLKMIKDLVSMDGILDSLALSLFVQNNKGQLLNEDGDPIKTHGGQPVLKLTLETVPDLERLLGMKTRIQDQTRKIEGEPDVTVKEEKKTELISVDNAIAKVVADELAKRNTEADIGSTSAES